MANIQAHIRLVTGQDGSFAAEVRHYEPESLSLLVVRPDGTQEASPLPLPAGCKIYLRFQPAELQTIVVASPAVRAAIAQKFGAHIEGSEVVVPAARAIAVAVFIEKMEALLQED